MKRGEEGTALAGVREVYGELAKRPVERNCGMRTECCRFRLTGKTPYLTKGEALVAAKAWRAAGRKELPEPGPDGACPMLHPVSGKCGIYEDRPFGCRTHFCAAAGGPYDRKQVADLIHRLEVIDRELGGSGGQRLEVAVGAALMELQVNRRGRRERGGENH